MDPDTNSLLTQYNSVPTCFVSHEHVQELDLTYNCRMQKGYKTVEGGKET